MTDEPTATDDVAAAPEPGASEPGASEPGAPEAGPTDTSPPAARAADAADAEGSTPTSAEYTVAFSPRNVAVGLAIVAGLVGLILRRRRRGKDG